MELCGPLQFRPVYQPVVWGGRRMERWRADLPGGPIGESWDLADHKRGMSVVNNGPLEGRTLGELTQHFGCDLVGKAFRGGSFPLMVKLIDATDKLSLQVHPDDSLAQRLGFGKSGKSECWLILEDGGELFQGTKRGVDRTLFEAALARGTVVETLNRFEVRSGDFYFVQARTVHAIGAGCLLYEIQQPSDVTFRVYDWDRLGLDGKPRALHVAESLDTIDFTRSGFGPRRPLWDRDVERGGKARTLVASASFHVEERALAVDQQTMEGGSNHACSIVICLEGSGELVTAQGSAKIFAMSTLLVPALSGKWRISSPASLRVLVATPRLGSD